MFLKIYVCCFALLVFFSTVEGTSIAINPSSMVVGSSSANPVARIEVQCNSNGISNIESVYRLEISRRRFSDLNFASIASVDGYKITKSFPPDMKSPNATGSLVSVAEGEPPTSGTLVVTMDGGELTCSDQAEFKCTMTYKTIGLDVTPPSSDSDNFTVITTPNDVRIIDALYEENGAQLQLENDKQLKVGTRIKYRCSANIGSDSTVVISWERSPVMGTSTDFVPYITADSNDIVQDPVTSTSCSYTRTSSMYYNMTSSDDDGVTFRCKARSYLSGNWYESISIQRRTFAVPSGGTSKPTIQPVSSGGTSKSTIQPVPSGGTSKPTIQPGANTFGYEVLAIVLGVLLGVCVVLNVILSVCLHRYRKLAEELQFQAQKDHLNAYDRLNITVGRSEPYDMLERNTSDGRIPKDKKTYVNMAHNVL